MKLSDIITHEYEAIGESEIEKKLNLCHVHPKPLRIKAGFDPTAPDLHLGHTVLLNLLRKFQDLGHLVLLVIGDFTAMIGDPSGVTTARKALSPEEVIKNAQTYKDQVFKILNPHKTELLFNSTWLSELKLQDLIGIASKYTVQGCLNATTFIYRYKENLPISIHEFLYPLLQGYDSVHLKCGIEIGGMDQKFNLLVGRELQKSFGQNPQSIIMLPLLEGLDGKMKMSKSLGNAICLNHSPQEMFGKIMSISDTLLEKYITLLSVGSKDSKKAFIEYLHMDTNPRDVKMLLAEELTALYHGPDAAISTKAEFIDRFQKKALPKNSEIVTLQVTENGLNIVHLLKYSCLTKTNMEARRHIKSGAVRINGEKIDNESYMIYANSENLFQVGKTKARVVRLRQWIASADQLTNSHTQDRSE